MKHGRRSWEDLPPDSLDWINEDQIETADLQPPPAQANLQKTPAATVVKPPQTKAPRLGAYTWGHVLLVVWATVGAIATSLDVGLVTIIERQTQALFTHLRGPVNPPEEIVILAIDEQSLDQGKIYADDPEQYPELEPLQSWPWQRSAYAIAAERLMQAGAQVVALDLIFDLPSTYGDEDDQQLREVLERYPGQITLAASYEDELMLQGSATRLIEPNPVFRSEDLSVGFINYRIELDGRIHRQGRIFPELLAETYPELAAHFLRLGQEVPSFDQEILQTAQLPYPRTSGEYIFFYGSPQRTFRQYPFWHVLDPTSWQHHVQQGDFEDKIVLIGPTATLLQDMHNTPVGTMPGIEVHANAIATLLEGRAIAEAIPNAYLRGLLIWVGVVGTGWWMSRPSQVSSRLLRMAGAGLGWGGVSYLVFTFGRLILPTATPVVVIAIAGLSYLMTGLAKENLRKLSLRKALKQYAGSPIIQAVISQQDDLQDLLQEREREVLGKQLGGRYKVLRVLGAGGFGATYIAGDAQRPGMPRCVVKQLRPASNDVRLFKLARRLFQREAETLERLGKHDQIPQLLAYFEEEQEFYLVQEFIEGHSLGQELPLGKRLSESSVVNILQDLLQILQFIHSCGVIHRDIKPSNVVRRHLDNRLVLIDFGAVKELSNPLGEDPEAAMNTVGIGTRGYMPNEQCAGSPRFNSDIYAVGIIGIQAVTGLVPDRLPEDPKTAELVWQDKAAIKPELAAILTKMVCYDFKQRYQSADAVLADLNILSDLSTALPPPKPALIEHLSHLPTSELSGPVDDPEASTLPWPNDFDDDTRV